MCSVKDCIWNGKYCRVHPNAKETPTQKIKSVSDKRKEDNKVYSKKRKEFLAKHPLCMAQLVGCKKKATQVHHQKGRVGENFLNEKTWIAVCHPCHEVIERNPLFARVMGLSKSRLSNKA